MLPNVRAKLILKNDCLNRNSQDLIFKVCFILNLTLKLLYCCKENSYFTLLTLFANFFTQ